MGIPNPTHQIASNAIASCGNYISLHTDAGGTSGANETSGGSYARQQSTPWAADGVGDNSGPQVNIPCAAGTYKEGGIWSTASGTALSAPSGAGAAGSGTGGTFAAATYYWKVTAFNFSGETTASSEVSAVLTGTTSSCVISWSALTGVHDQTGIGALFAGYKIYRGTTSNGENVLVGTVAASATSYTDTGAGGTSATIPVSNTASTFVGSAAFTGGNVSVTGSGASVNVTPTITA